jgi:hypothetical protein
MMANGLLSMVQGTNITSSLEDFSVEKHLQHECAKIT